MSTNEERDGQARKWVWGCTGGCLGVIIILVIAIVLGIRYLVNPVAIVPPETFLTPETSAFLFVRVDPDSPLMAAILVDVARRPELLSKLPTKDGQPLQLDRQTAAANLLGFGKLQTVVILQPDGDGMELHGGVAASVRRGSRLIGLAIKGQLKDAEDASEYRGAHIARASKESFMAVRGNNYMTSDRLELLKTWAERLEQQREREAQASDDQPAAPPLTISPPLRRAYDRLDTALPVVFAVLNANGELAALAELASSDQAKQLIAATDITAQQVISISGQLRPLNDTDASLTILIECADAAFAGRTRNRLEMTAQQAGDRWPMLDMVVTQPQPTVLKVEGRIEDLPTKTADMVAAAIRRAGQTPGPAAEEAPDEGPPAEEERADQPAAEEAPRAEE